MDSVANNSSGQPEVKVAVNTDDRGSAPSATKPKARSRRKKEIEPEEDDNKRRCVSTACIACRKRKSKCDGNTPACAACSQVYGTECIYDPNSDHRRKGVYKNDLDSLKTRNSTLQTLISAILNYPEDDVAALVQEIRTCESLDAVANRIVAKENGAVDEVEGDYELRPASTSLAPTFESNLYGRMGDLRLDEGTVRYIGGTSNLIHLTQEDSNETGEEYMPRDDAVTSWTDVTDDADLITHLLNMYFTWHYTYFTTLSKTSFYKDFLLGKPPANTRRKTWYCTPLLVNAMLALGCHFTSHAGAREDPEDSATAGDHFFKEAKRLILENDEHEKPRLTTVQALALMSVREAGCGREAKGWVYSGMSFRMACDMGLNLDSGRISSNRNVGGDEAEEDVRRITFWGCYLFDKCWSNYMGRLPQLPTSIATCSKVEVFPDEDSAQWSPYTNSGFTQAHAQPARTRAVSLQITKLCEISNDLMNYFYNPLDMEKTKGKAAELKKLSDIHTRLEAWRRELPKELEPREGGLSSVLVMHMFFQLLFIHLFRPFLKYTQATSPLPHNVSPRKLCTQSAAMISKLMRLYKRSHGLRQICNIAVYIAHSACTIHLLNLPDKNAKRDIVHGVKHLEEIAEGWLCARRTLGILSVLARKWKVELPEDAATVLTRTDAKFGAFESDAPSPTAAVPPRQPQQMMNPSQFTQPAYQHPARIPTTGGYLNNVPLQMQSSLGRTQSGAPVRPHSGNHALPPEDAHGLRAQQYPSAAATPSSTSGQQRQRGSIAVSSRGSPSDMFGGIEQLIRDSQEWAYRDQANMAVGFDNWGGLEHMDPTPWPSSQQVLQNASTNGPGVAQGGPVGMHLPTSELGYASEGAAVANSNQSLDLTTWMNGMNAYNPIATYNEDEWYQ
ncbi:Nitrogen assimilation transcription factor nit-4 [Teratosphaeria destructans]|uniref:Nitrogen assimilation transcription factor nit-4 n=1 Tax=Teratosphaeria destructans TaxID=418781 RepID=A0A9W7SS28_9PEZI|nr:Nitrogen assimilation transcription factor nit-4 [Teratosphaeria destructans]